MSKKTLSTFIVSTILFLIAVVGISVMIYQVNEQGKQLSIQVETLEKKNAQEDSYFKLQKLSDETEEDRLVLSSYFLAQESNSIDFLNTVESLAPSAGVVLKTESLNVEDSKTDGLNWVEATFSFSGSRERVKNFIEVLETLPYVSRVTSVRMSAVSGSEWRAQVTMKVQVLNHDE